MRPLVGNSLLAWSVKRLEDESFLDPKKYTERRLSELLRRRDGCREGGLAISSLWTKSEVDLRAGVLPKKAAKRSLELARTVEGMAAMGSPRRTTQVGV